MRRRASSLRSTDVVVRTRPGREVILFGKTSNGSCWVDSQRNELRRGGTQPNNRSRGQLFRSFFAGGFECSTHLLHPGLRLDLVRSTDHDKFAYQDYLRLTQQSGSLGKGFVGTWLKRVVISTTSVLFFPLFLPLVRRGCK